MKSVRGIDSDVLGILDWKHEQNAAPYDAGDLAQRLARVACMLQRVRAEAPVDALVAQVAHVLKERLICWQPVYFAGVVDTPRLAINDERLDRVRLIEFVRRVAVVAAEIRNLVIVE